MKKLVLTIWLTLICALSGMADEHTYKVLHQKSCSYNYSTSSYDDCDGWYRVEENVVIKLDLEDGHITIYDEEGVHSYQVGRYIQKPDLNKVKTYKECTYKYMVKNKNNDAITVKIMGYGIEVDSEWIEMYKTSYRAMLYDYYYF